MHCTTKQDKTRQEMKCNGKNDPRRVI